MADKYQNYDELLAGGECPGEDFTITSRDRQSPLVIVAPHGGKIEPGTSEIAAAIAGSHRSLYLFEGHKRSRNRDLHISSHRFDAPGCRPLIAAAEAALGIHGDDCTDAVVYVGGTDEAMMTALGAALLGAGFDVRQDTSWNKRGEHPRNICNIGTRAAGAQLEIGAGLRRRFFASLKRQGRQQRTTLFYTFVSAVCSCL